MENLLRYDKDKVYTFIDLETENLCLSFINNRPWQCGMINAKGNEILQTSDIYIKWDKPIINTTKLLSILAKLLKL